jgi:hypothetical protein
MTLTIKHAKTNAESDWTQAQLDAQILAGNFSPGTTLSQITLPSDWNATHTITGTIDQTQNNVAVDGSTVTGDGTPGNPLVSHATATSIAFSGITSGSNTTAAMTVGAGGTLTYSSTGTITATHIAVANEATDATCFPLFATTATGDQAVKSNANFTFNSNTGTLGATSFSGGDLTLSQTSSPAYARGKLVYDTSNESLTFFNNDTNISLQIGQEEWIRVTNNSGSSIANGSAVYLNGASAGMPTIALAQSNASTTTIGAGLTTETIANGAIGYVTCIGVVHGLDTSLFTAGQIVYVSSTVAGGLTSTAPIAPNYRYRVGIVGVSSATVGTIHVTPSTASLGNGSANQLFGMNTAGTAQEVKTLAAGTGITVTPGTNTLTIASTGGSSPDSMWFGDGSDGNVTISSGTTTMTRDMYYNNLTISGTGSLNSGQFRIFVAGTLDISAAPANAIVSTTPNNGANASGSTGGAAGAAIAVGNRTIGPGLAGSAGANGVTTGGASSAVINLLTFMGGQPGGGGNSEKGGNAGGNTGGTQAANVLGSLNDPRYATPFPYSIMGANYGSSNGGAGGASGAGDGTNAGGGGGGGGCGAIGIFISANTINRSSSTGTNAINSPAGNGGNGAQSPGGTNRSGGMGGCGGGGSLIYIIYKTLSGTTKTGLITANGGNGGNGGAGLGVATGGYGGAAGKAGVIILVQLGGTVSVATGSRTVSPVALAGGANTLVTGGTGTTGETLSVTL